MAIEKMLLMNLLGSLDEEHAILQELVLCENVHLNIEHSNVNDNHLLMREFEAAMPSENHFKQESCSELESRCNDLENTVVQIAADLDIQIEAGKKHIRYYGIDDAVHDLKAIKDKIEPSIDIIKLKRAQIRDLSVLKDKTKFIRQTVDFQEIKKLNFFNYELGMLSKDNKLHIKRNYENISALVFQLGDIEDSREDMYLVLYLKQFKEETQRILKSLNWHELHIPEGIIDIDGDINTAIDQKITELKLEIDQAEKAVLENKDEVILRLNKIFSRIKLEQRIVDLKQQIIHGNNVFMLNAWVRKKHKEKIEEVVGDVTDKYVTIFKTREELGKEFVPPTLLKNNWFFKPFEAIVKLYGLPAYNEIDPTPFLAITFCLMFGIMFGDIGQGLVYFLAGVFLYKRNELAGGVLTRLGLSSVAFGFVYGSVFGLEEVPFIHEYALIQGGPLNKANIMPILLAGVTFGVVILTLCFLIGIVNALRRGEIEHGIFGKNGIVGYLFFMGLIMTAVTVTKVIPVSVIVPICVMIITLVLMVFKEPLAHLIEKKRPLIKGDKGSYYIESIFEGIETILSSLSNGISFIRVGAFALNHAGLFMAFKVISDMLTNPLLKVLVLLLGNILILSLEGLVVFIQGLRLQYYEMFSKYFKGDGIDYHPVKI